MMQLLQHQPEIFMTARFTDRTIRNTSCWVKITRDNKKRTFTFAKGYAGNFQANQIETLPFKWVANWSEANDRANGLINF
jgi:hypothetical protein